MKLYRQTHNAKPTHKTPISEGDFNKLKEYFRNRISIPAVLQEYVWFSLCYKFGRRGREGWRTLLKTSFEIKTDDVGVEYVTQVLTESTKNHQSAKQDTADFSDNRIHEVNTDTLLCPVRTFRNHIENLNPDSPFLFQTPKKTTKRDGACMFLPVAMGKNTLTQMMPNLSEKANLSKRYTNHCVRASTITTLSQNGISGR